MNEAIIEQLVHNKNLEENFTFLSQNVSSKIVFSTSFGIEDQLISHLIFSAGIQNIEIFTLDTGRLFPETYTTWHNTELQYNTPIKSYYPNNAVLEDFIDNKGINPFYESVELRKQCCHIRKVEPLNRALKGANVWITGLRAEHSLNRNKLKTVEWDETHQLYKYNPLLHWTTQNVKEYVVQKGIPYNVLHDKGFVSIGCAPCTRAIRKDEDFRAGRWWWEDTTKKECGLHR